MHRRALLSAAAAATVAALVGCTGLDEDAGDGGSDVEEVADQEVADETTDDGSDDGEPTETPAEGPPRLEDTSFEVLRVDPGVGADRTDWSVEDGVVTVEGSIGGSDTCYTARLASAAYDADADLLSVEVESYRDADPEQACAMTLVEIDYRARFTFSGGSPTDVAVDHHSPGGG